MRRQQGFTLIELMIVVAVIAILAAIAIPNYLEQTRKGRRADAVRTVGEIQLGLERWRAENPCYGRSAASPCTTFTESGTYPAMPTATDSPYYTLGVTNATATGYVITATRTPGGKMANDPNCGNFVMTAAAGAITKSMTSGGTVAYCWSQ